MIPELSAAVLAGGRSTRMGRDKALIDLDGRPLVLHAVEQLRTVSDDVFVVAKETEHLGSLGLRVVRDDAQTQTPLVGIGAALRAAAHPYVFVCACDMPFVSRDVVRLIASRAIDLEAAVPVHNDHPEPSHAVWSAGVAEKISAAVAGGERAVHRVLDTLHVAWIEEAEWRAIDPDGRSFVNVNTPEELARLTG